MKVDDFGHLDSAGGIASFIDHTLLKPQATKDDIARLCGEAREHQFATVCINPYWVRMAAAELRGERSKVCTVIGFPLGANRMRTKLFEAETALADGARELDVVLNVGALRSGNGALAGQEMERLATLAHASGALLKVILETCLLDDEQKKTACELAAAAKADFVKTSTGFSDAGATAADVRLMRNAVGPGMGVKASGGIRTFAALCEMVTAGANRIGTSSGLKILAEFGKTNSPTLDHQDQAAPRGNISY